MDWLVALAGAMTVMLLVWMTTVRAREGTGDDQLVVEGNGLAGQLRDELPLLGGRASADSMGQLHGAPDPPVEPRGGTRRHEPGERRRAPHRGVDAVGTP